jgi:hypothetical protein
MFARTLALTEGSDVNENIEIILWPLIFSLFSTNDKFL